MPSRYTIFVSPVASIWRVTVLHESPHGGDFHKFSSRLEAIAYAGTLGDRYSGLGYDGTVMLSELGYVRPIWDSAETTNPTISDEYGSHACFCPLTE